MWLCCHPLDEPGHEDRMTTRYLTSADGLAWSDRGEVLAGRPGEWDARGARVTRRAARRHGAVRRPARRGVQLVRDDRGGRLGRHRLVPDPNVAPIVSPYSDGAFRYARAVPLRDGRIRYYVEAARDDGAHDLVTFVR